jgi:hypothetical protein
VGSPEAGSVVERVNAMLKRYDQASAIMTDTDDLRALLAVVEAAQELADNESEHVVGRRIRDALAAVYGTPDSAEED